MTIVEAATRAPGAIAGLPMLVAIITARDVLIVTLARLLGLPNRVRAPLNRQVIRGLRRRPRLFGTLRATLPLPTAVLLLLGAIKMLVLRPRLVVLDMRVLRARLVDFGARLIVLRTWLVILRSRLFVALPSAFGTSFMLTAPFRARVVGHHVRANGHHQQTYTCHTPDALHAIPHCG